MRDDFALFENGKSYTAMQIARLLGRASSEKLAVRWVRQNVFHKGCWSKKIGNQLVTTGEALNRWINDQSEGWDDEEDSGEAA